MPILLLFNLVGVVVHLQCYLQQSVLQHVHPPIPAAQWVHKTLPAPGHVLRSAQAVTSNGTVHSLAKGAERPNEVWTYDLSLDLALLL